MAKLTITLTDHESGNVHIESKPTIEQLVHIAKTAKHTMSPAETYALVALRRLIEFSGEIVAQGTGGTPRTRLQ